MKRRDNGDEVGEEVGDAERGGETERRQREKKRRRRQIVDVGARRRTSTLARWQPVPYNTLNVHSYWQYNQCRKMIILSFT